MKYKCFRCGYISNHKGNFTNHLNRKKICFSSLCDISIENIKKYYNIIYVEKSSETPPKYSKSLFKNSFKILQKNYTTSPKSFENYQKLSPIQNCIYCGNKFTMSDNLNRHYNRCKNKKKMDENKNIENIENIENEKNEKIKLLKKDKEDLINTVEKLLIECCEMKQIITNNNK